MTGVERRRRRSSEDKLEIIAESLAEGAVVSEVARRHVISPQQLFGWRARVRAERAAAKAAEADGSQFVPALVAPDARTTPAAKVPGSIEIVIGGARVRVGGCVDARLLAVVFKALRMTL